MLLLCQSYCCIFEFILFGVCWSFLNLNMYGFRQTWEFFSHFFKYIFLHWSLSSPSGASITQMVSLLIVFLKICSFFFNFHLFSLCSSDWIMSIDCFQPTDPFPLQSPTRCKAHPVNFSFQRFNFWAVTFPIGSFVVFISLLGFPIWVTMFLTF